MKKFLFSIITLLFVFFSYAQTYTISGFVKDKKGIALDNVAINVKGTNKSVLTDSVGFFQFKNLVAGNYTLVIYVEPKPQEQTIVVKENITSIEIIIADEKKDLGEVIVVASSRTNSRIEDLPTKVEVLGAEEVGEENQIKPGNIASLLGDIAGIQIQQTNAATGNADMRIQGLQGKYTQILRDGIPLFGSYSGSFGILQIPPLDLQQIELVKGASSTLYGGGAIAGMLNLVSKKPKLSKPEHAVTLNTSTLQENNANFFLSNRNTKDGYTFFAGTTLQNNVDVNKDGFSDVPKTKNIFIHPRWFHYFNTKANLVLGYTLNYEDRIGGDMQVLNNAKDATHQFFIKNKNLRNTIDAVYENKISTNQQLTFKSSISFNNRSVETNLYGMKANETLWFNELSFYQKLKKHHVVIGANFNGTTFTKQQPDSTLLSNETFNNIGLFVQDDWKITNNFTLQTGIRTDVHANYGVFVLPRVSMMYKPNKQISMRLGSGFGYKTPTLINGDIDDRMYRYIAGYNSNIVAEKSYGANFDINYKTKIDDWEITFNNTFFYNQVNNPISLKYGFSTGWGMPYALYDNEVKPLQTTGFETYLAAKQDELEIYAGYVYTNALRKYDVINTQLPLIAKHKIATVIAYEFSEKCRAGIEAAYTGKQYLDNGSTTKPYVFGAAMMRYVVKKFSFVLNCENLFDFRQSKKEQIVFPPNTNPVFPEIWGPLDGRVINFCVMIKW